MATAVSNVQTQFAGMAYPFTPAAGGVFGAKPTAAVVGTSLLNLMTTPVGYCPWNPSFGSVIALMRFERLDGILLAQARYELLRMIEKFEPRARVIDAIVSEDPFRPNRVFARVIYKLANDETPYQVSASFGA